MKVLVYANNSKDDYSGWLKKVSAVLVDEKIDYEIISAADLNKTVSADAVIVYGGDGTILSLTDFCNKNDIAIIGINAGTVGFLTEFETKETALAIKLLKKGKLKRDERATLNVNVNDKTFVGLNDAVLSRVYSDSADGLVVSVSVNFDDIFVDKITGDGVIVSTPTGSTAYSLSAGGAILSPGINAFIMTPLSSHSLHSRPIVFSADTTCTLKLESATGGLFIDGKKVSSLGYGDFIRISKLSAPTVFLRKENSDFFSKLDCKLNVQRRNV